MKLTGKDYEERLLLKYNGIYSIVGEYEGMHKPIEVWCSIHKEVFTVRALDLVHGECRCKSCIKQGRIDKSIALHSSKLPTNRKLVCSKGFETKRSEVTFECTQHGTFLSTFDKVINTTYHGCKKCKSYKESLLFIEKANIKHNSKYNYNPEDYICSRTLLPIYCPVHNKTFSQRPSAHLQGQNCPDCGDESRLRTSTHTQKQFLEKCEDKHGNTYDYGKVLYKGSYKEVTITCRKHGDFVMKPCNHLIGHGCSVCGSKRYTLEDFIKVSKNRFGGRFSYEKTNYSYSNEPVEITCTLHDHTFSIQPNHHLSKSDSGGCKYCGKLLMNRWSIESVRKIKDIETSSGYLYLGRLSGVEGYKVGVTNNLRARQHTYNDDLSKYTENNFEYLGYINTTYLKSFIMEEALKKVFEDVNNKSHGLDFGGKSEIFLLDKNHLDFMNEIFSGEHLDYLEEHEDKIINAKSEHFKGLVNYFKSKIERK